MTDDELRKLAEAALEDDKAATPGPWRRSNGGIGVVTDARNAEWVCRVAVVSPFEDATLIAAARAREPELARAVLRLLEERTKFPVTGVHRADELTHKQRVARMLRIDGTCSKCGTPGGECGAPTPSGEGDE